MWFWFWIEVGILVSLLGLYIYCYVILPRRQRIEEESSLLALEEEIEKGTTPDPEEEDGFCPARNDEIHCVHWWGMGIPAAPAGLRV